jgi:hypothetical protein
MTNRDQDTTPNVTAKDANQRSVQREEHPIEAMPDAQGNVKEINKDQYPETAAAHSGTATPPSGQGGATPKSRPDYQDQFPANPEPSDVAKAWGQKVDEVGAVQAHSDAINQSGDNVKQEGPTKREAK